MANKELSPELRIMLAFALSFLILLLSRPLLVRPPQPPAAGPGPAAEPSQPARDKLSPGKEEAQLQADLPAAPVAGQAEELIIVESDRYRVVLSTRGAVVKSWTLKEYKDERGGPLEVVHSEAAQRYGEPLSVWVADESARAEVNQALFVPSASGELRAPLALSFEYRGERVAARKQIVFAPDSYVVEIDSTLSADGRPVPHELAWRGGFGDRHDAVVRGTRWDVFYRQPDRMVRLAAGEVEGAASHVSGPFLFAGIEDHFFAAAFLPAQTGLRVTAFPDEVKVLDQEDPVASIGVAVGVADSPANRLRLFVGPKQTDILASVHPHLPELINYGWSAFVAKPLFWALKWTHDHIAPNYGWSIVLLTILINMLLFPLKISSLRSARKMQQLQPQLRAIQAKYKGMKFKDPRRQQMSQETMELYKKHGVNPFGGCLPMLLQLPFLWAFYQVLLVSIEMRQAPWIRWWVPDLSAPEPHLVKTLPLLMCGSQFVLQKMSPAPSPDPAQQKVMLFLPVLFLVFFWNISSGLVLYWLTGNLVGIGQQWYINRTELQQQVAEKRAAAAAKKKRKQDGRA